MTTLRKFLVCYLGMGNGLTLRESFGTKQEALHYLETADFSNSSLESTVFFIMDATEFSTDDRPYAERAEGYTAFDPELQSDRDADPQRLTRRTPADQMRYVLEEIRDHAAAKGGKWATSTAEMCLAVLKGEK